MNWCEIENGGTIGTRGSEEGVIIRDEEYATDARITIERDGVIAPYSITCGIYGWMFHTCFFSTLVEAETDFEKMKIELTEIILNLPHQDDLDKTEKSQIVNQKIEDFVLQH